MAFKYLHMAFFLFSVLFLNERRAHSAAYEHAEDAREYGDQSHGAVVTRIENPREDYRQDKAYRLGAYSFEKSPNKSRECLAGCGCIITAHAFVSFGIRTFALVSGKEHVTRQTGTL